MTTSAPAELTKIEGKSRYRLEGIVEDCVYRRGYPSEFQDEHGGLSFKLKLGDNDYAEFFIQQGFCTPPLMNGQYVVGESCPHKWISGREEDNVYVVTKLEIYDEPNGRKLAEYRS